MSSLKNSYSKIAQQDNENILSEIMEVDEVILLDIPRSSSHNFAGIVYYSDPNGDNIVTPSAGTATVRVKTPTQSQGFQDLTNGVLDSTLVTQTNWDGNAEQVQVTFAGVLGATHARLIVTSNAT